LVLRALYRPRSRAAAPTAMPSRFAVGDRAEYWSDTYQQWMPGTVQRVRDGGAVYDLDVKKGAQASKLRLARHVAPQEAESIFSIVDRNHDGVISRSEFQGALQTHVIECPTATTARSAGATVSVPVTAPLGRPGKASTMPLSARGAGGVRQELADPAALQRFRPPSRGDPEEMYSQARLAVQEHSEVVPVLPRRRPPSRDPEALAQLRRRAEGAVTAAALQDHRSRSSSLQAKRLHGELAQAAKAGEWAEAAGQDMVSRAGAVTVRKMVETTKALLQGLEGALILRAGFIAGCFHMWRCETTLSRAGRLYQEEFERHHDQWAAHMDHHRRSFEAELRAHAERAMSHRQLVRRQQGMLLDRWAHGDKRGLTRQTLRIWCTYALKQKCLKTTASRIHTAIYTWAEGKAKGLVHAAVAAWHHLTRSQREVRLKEGELEQAHGSYQQRIEEERKRNEERFRERMLALEAREKKGHRDIESIIVKWERGSRKGLLTLVLVNWRRDSKKQASATRRRGAVEMELKRWTEGNAKGSLHCCYLQWKMLTVQASITGRHRAEHQAEVARLERMLTDKDKAHQDILQQHMTAAQRQRDRAKNTVEASLLRWDAGDRKGRGISTLRSWHQCVQEIKRAGRKRQAVHDALLRSLEGDKKAAVHLAVLNWATLTRNEKHARVMEDRVAKEAEQWEHFLDERQRAHEDTLASAQDVLAQEKAKAHAATELMLRRWMGGDTQGLKATVFADWRKSLQLEKRVERKRTAVHDAVLRFADGEARGILHSVFLSWRNYVRWDAAHNRAHQEKDARIDKLEQQVQRMLSHKEMRLKKYGEMLAGRRGSVIRGMCFSSWKEESKGVKGRLESQRLEEVRLQEIERLHKMAESLHREQKSKVISFLGCKDVRVLLTEYFQAWSYTVQKQKEQWAMKCNHNEAMSKYSSFMLGQRLKRDSLSLLTSTFAEWHREAKILLHQRHRDHAHRSVEDSQAYIAQLEQQRTDLQEQLGLYYQQIDLITETLQKELKTKEELAAELRSAYGKMRKSNYTPTTAASDRPPADMGGFSRTSSDQTLDAVVVTPRGSPRAVQTTPRASPSAGLGERPQAHDRWRLPGPAAELPPSPSVALARCGDLLHSRGRKRLPAAASSRDISPSQCDWEQAVSRMDEEGMVRLDSTRKP